MNPFLKHFAFRPIQHTDAMLEYISDGFYCAMCDINTVHIGEPETGVFICPGGHSVDGADKLSFKWVVLAICKTCCDKSFKES